VARLENLYEDLAYSLAEGGSSDFSTLMRMKTLPFHEFLEAARRNLKTNPR